MNLSIEFIINIKASSVKTLIQGMPRIIVLDPPCTGFPPGMAAKGTAPELGVFRPPPFSSIGCRMASEQTTAIVYKIEKCLTVFAFKTTMQAGGIQDRDRIKLLEVCGSPPG